MSTREIKFTAESTPTPSTIPPAESGGFNAPEIRDAIAEKAASSQASQETETPEQKIARLDKQLAEARRFGERAPIEDEDGNPTTIKQVLAEHEAWMEQYHADKLKADREYTAVVEQANAPTLRPQPDGSFRFTPAANLAAEKPILTSRDEAVALMGLKTFADMTPQQKALMLDCRPSDIEKLGDLKHYFGKGSDPELANALAKKSPGVYKLAKQEAIRRRIF